MFSLLAVIQYEMEAQYKERSMLTDLFLENKFWGWVGLFTIFFAVCAIAFYQIRTWDEEDQDTNRFNY